jgi:hypothetical protein
VTFREDYAAAAEDLESYYSQEIRYIDPAYSEPVELLANVHKDRRERRILPNGGTQWITVRDVILFDHTEPAVSARQDAILTIDGEDYAVVSTGKPSEGRTKLTLKRVESQEIARKGYRSR